jgi:2-amino-4-hydroxy-6-hydroxymethyldihydropteridine diphosphokinase
MPRAWIALGGNQGCVRETFERTLTLLNRSPENCVISSSQNYTTSPVGASAGGRFLNAAVEIETSLTPFELLTQLHAIEAALGRIRTLHWGPRTLDLDLLFYADAILETPTLTVPHPHLWFRRFVLEPLVEISPHLTHPQINLTVGELAQRLTIRPLPCTLSGGDEPTRMALQQQTASAFPDIQWQPPAAGTEILNFWLGGEPTWNSLPSRSKINVAAFPTAPEQTLQDVLTAALGTVRLA